MRFTEGSFDEDMGPTIGTAALPTASCLGLMYFLWSMLGVDFKSKELNLNGNEVSSACQGHVIASDITFDCG